jgi:hypothetical protein
MVVDRCQKFAKYPQSATVKIMKALFVELPSFTRFRADYLDDDSFRALQKTLMGNPKVVDVIEGVGGLRKLRYAVAGIGG